MTPATTGGMRPESCASVGFNAGGHSTAHLQGPPAALRELAAALIEAADQAEGADDPAPALVEGVGG
jgi:hypothetical protein